MLHRGLDIALIGAARRRNRLQQHEVGQPEHLQVLQLSLRIKLNLSVRARGGAVACTDRPDPDDR